MHVQHAIYECMAYMYDWFSGKNRRKGGDHVLPSVVWQEL
jgi:hypothetical protein